MLNTLSKTTNLLMDLWNSNELLNNTGEDQQDQNMYGWTASMLE